MLSQDGNISFAAELVQMVEAFLGEYEAKQGPFRNDLERGLVISYALGVMRCELDAIWDRLAEEPVFGSLHPRTVFETCAHRDDVEEAVRAFVATQLGESDWIS